MCVLSIWKSVGLSAESDCSLPLVPLLKTRRMLESMHRCVGGPAEHLSQFQHSLCLSVYVVCGSVYILCMFVGKWSRLQTKHIKDKRKLDWKGHRRSVLFPAVITRRTILLCHACMHVHAALPPFIFICLLSLNMHTLNLTQTQSAIMTKVQVALLYRLHTKLTHNNYTL